MSSPFNTLRINILMVEDNPTDVMLATEALSNVKTANQLHVAEDGVEAMDFLYQKGSFATAPRPDLIFLDLNMPRKNGHEVLAEIKSDIRLRHVPVVILTTSKSEADIASAYDLHANCYIVKPVEFDRFALAVQSVVDLWFTVATPPPQFHS
jgi:two-component system, chemotaxis family, response regulator Rcp1